MKSYLKFLSRNKLYTAIEEAGLIVSLAFVVIISCYVWQQFEVTRAFPDHERSFVVTNGDEYLDLKQGAFDMVAEQVPEVETAARSWNFTRGAYFNGELIKGGVRVLAVDPEFFSFFNSKLEHKIRREPFEISLHRLVKSLGFHFVQLRQIEVQHHLLSTDLVNQVLDKNKFIAHN